MESIAEIPEWLRREYQHYLIGRGRYGLPEIAPTTRLIRLKNVAHQGHRANRLEIWFFDAITGAIATLGGQGIQNPSISQISKLARVSESAVSRFRRDAGQGWEKN